jgi:N-acyl homoserine lactone hydrolase
MSFKSSLHVLCLSLLTVAATVPAYAADAVKEVRLYTLDCGHIKTKDLSGFSDTGEYDGRPGGFASPCFLVRHPKGTLLWDTGLSDKLAENKDGVVNGGFHLSVPVTLADQIKRLGLTTADVTYVAFSHFHFDHTGNANLFGESTWIINKAELAWAESNPAPFGVDQGSISGYKSVKTQIIDGDHDVFGDGSVRILKAPGHTPGHQVLKVQLKTTGALILSGDLYHLRANRKFARVPVFNVERADTLASFDRIEKIAKNSHARFVVQHDQKDFESLPKLPGYLD